MSSVRRIRGVRVYGYRRHMRRPAVSVVALILLAAAVSVGLGLEQRRPAIDWFFGAVVLSAVLLVGRTSWRAFRAAARQRNAAAGLDAVNVQHAALQAVIEERRRLARDIEASVRDSLGTVVAMVTALDGDRDPRPGLTAIQAEATRATTDLRRQLGLLRAEEEVSATKPADAAASLTRLRRGDWLLTVGVVALAAAELAVFPPLEDLVLTPLTIAFTLGAAATVLGRRLAPEPASTACGGVLALGALTDQPVLDGFWLVLTIGVFGWSCAALATWRAWLVIGVLAGCTVVSRLLNRPENAPILMAMYVVAVIGGATVGRSRRMQSFALAKADARMAELGVAAGEAVGAERRMMARELHDVVSHAVSVIAVQAAAAEVSWPAHPSTVRGAVDVIMTTAQQTVAELDRLLPGRTPVRHDTADLCALVDRARAAGLEVTLEVSGEARWLVPQTVYRVVQEALTNALRHAPGSHVLVRIQREVEQITIHVADDGPGSAADSRRGYGLIGLSERLRQVGGTLATRSRPEVTGFEVTAVLPTPAAVGAA